MMDAGWAPASAATALLRAFLCIPLLSVIAAAASAEEVGEVARMRPQVAQNDCRGKKLQDLQSYDALEHDWCVFTGARANGSPAAAGDSRGATSITPPPGPPGIVMQFDDGNVVGLGPDCSFSIPLFFAETRAATMSSPVEPTPEAVADSRRPGPTQVCDLFENCPRDSPPCKPLETPAATIRANGTTFHLRIEADGSTEVAVFEGSVRVESVAGGDPVEVDAGFRTFVKPGKRPTLKAPISADDVDRLRSLPIFEDSPWLDGPFDFEPLKSIGGRSFK